MKKIRHEQECFRRVQNFRRLFLPGEQLVERVQLHELKAGLRENFRPAKLS